MIKPWNDLLQRMLKWIAAALLKLTKPQAFFVLLAVALVVSLMLVLSIDFLWDGRFSSEMIFAGIVVPILDGALIVGLLSAFLGELREETERSKKAQEEIKFKNTILQTLQETPLDAILVVDENVMIISYNQQFVELWGFTVQTKERRLDASMLKSIAEQVEDQEAFIAHIHNLYAHRDMKSRKEIQLKDGRVIDQYSAPITGADGKYYGRVWYCRDITDSKRAEEQIRNFAFLDALTQLPNRRLLNDRLKTVMASGRRSGLYSAVVFIDLDNFKSLNDTHGHDVGDLLLIEAAHRITGCVREMDTVARFGGDEFVMILKELDTDKSRSVALANKIAEKVRTALEMPYFLVRQHNGNAKTAVEHKCTSSIGMVVFLDHEGTVDDILRLADKAMYQAKEDGRNTVSFFE
ncbi:sensor domain-containing diguanylate cyclase [bacterium]|nr:sensor domain-containing diguanylate cyclase [bacterium]